MQTTQIDEADRLFASAYEQNPRGLYLAWRAQVLQVMLNEQIRSDRTVLQQEAENYARQAFEKEPNNSTVLSILASTRMYIANDYQSAHDYSVRAVKRNFGNPVAWWALSSAHLQTGNPAKAYGAARMAVRLAEGTPFEFWTLSQLAGAAVSVREVGKAKQIFRRVSFGRPDFRPPLRYLLAIHATDEEWVDALASVERLKVLEPTFSIDRLANDTEYPIRLLHTSEDLDKRKVLSLM